jgi:hypothetical protein
MGNATSPHQKMFLGGNGSGKKTMAPAHKFMFSLNFFQDKNGGYAAHT